MKWLKKLFQREKATPIEPPPWEEIVEIMYDKDLGGHMDEVAEVIYSRDRSKRYVVLKSNKGFYKFDYEELQPLDEEELMWTNADSSDPKDCIFALWLPHDTSCRSFYGTLDEARRGISSHGAYKIYFE